MKTTRAGKDSGKPGTLRIIAGVCKKKRLLTVPGMATRPTADRLRETLFNILAFDVRDAVVLDLFAGTGALGLEALSRGAASCTFVENNPEALSVIRKNGASCPSLNDRITVISWDIRRGLAFLKDSDPKFTLVFADPPYGQNLIQPTLSALAESGVLAQEALIVVEHDAADAVPPLPQGWVIQDQRTYGRSTLTFFQSKKSLCHREKL